VSDARNWGLARANGEYVVPLDADNELLPEFIARTLAFMREQTDPAVVFVYTQRICFGENMTAHASSFPPYTLTRLKQHSCIDACALVKTNVAQEVRYDPAFHALEDYDFYLSLAERALRGVLLDQPLYRYRLHPDTMTARVRREYRQMSLARQILAKHTSLFTPAERRAALRSARNRVVVSVIQHRSPDAPMSDRLRDLCYLARHRPAIRDLIGQMLYTMRPATLRRTT
jgi:glycosyltransferase involved in cell wall biosynthesis